MGDTDMASIGRSIAQQLAAIAKAQQTLAAQKQTGWTAMTGTADKATARATSTITLEQLAERVKAIQDALTAAGILAP